MKHAGPTALAALGGLLASLRILDGMVERKPGIFYRQGQAFLHFHEDAAGLFADMKIAGEWNRFPVNNAAEGDGFRARVKKVAGG